MPKIFGGASAAAAAPSSGTQYVLTTGTSTAYVATPATAITLADGAEILCGIHATNGATPTLNVSGTGAKAIYKESAAGLVAIGTGELISGPNIYRFTYNAGFTAWVVSSNIPDSAKLALDGSNAMTNRLQFSGTGTSAGAAVVSIFRNSGGDLCQNVAAGDYWRQQNNDADNVVMGSDIGLIFLTANTIQTAYYGFQRYSTNLYAGVPTGGFVGFNVNGVTQAAIGENGLVFSSVAQTSFGAAYASIFRDSTGDLNYNVADTDVHNFRENGGLCAAIGEFSSGYPSIRFYNSGAGEWSQLLDYAGGLYYDVGANNGTHYFRHNSASAPTQQARIGYDYSAIGTSNHGTTYPELVVHGLSETAYAGAIEVKVGGAAYTANDTWTNCFSLAKGYHTGILTLIITDSGGATYAQIYAQIFMSLNTINSVAVGTGNYTVGTSAGASNVAFRVSGGYLQVNVGSSVGNIKLGLGFVNLMVT